MKRLIIVYNVHSTDYENVQREVVKPARKLKGWLVGKYIIEPVSVNKNAQNLAKILQDGDLVVVAGGDGTASVGVNGVLWSEKKVTLGVLGYGNFNDLAHTLGAKSLEEILQAYKDKKIQTMWPLAISINDQFWRYAACYMTIGLLADSTKIFDKRKVRQKLQHRQRRLLTSLWLLMKWYFKTRQHRIFLPKVYLNGQERSYDMTDYLAINSKRVANVMRGGDWYLQQDVFWRSMTNMKSFSSLIVIMLQSILRRVPGKEVMSDVLEFEKPVSVSVQIEGEHHRLRNIQRITIDKSRQGLAVVKVR